MDLDIFYFCFLAVSSTATFEGGFLLVCACKLGRSVLVWSILG